jgi:AcrR family transcriptional regulator
MAENLPAGVAGTTWKDPDMPTPAAEAAGADVVRRGRPGKRDAIDQAARRVFGRDGYVRASIDAIAAEAGVSTRTIYNHFPGKEQLFTSVLHDSAAQVAETFVEMAGRLDPDDGLDAYLLGLARALVAQSTEHPEHFAMVRRILAEVDLFPPEAMTAWLEAGPRRVEDETARCLRDLADRGLVAAPDPLVAGRHFGALTAGQVNRNSPSTSRPFTKAQVDKLLKVGIHAFLHGYAPA